MTLALLSKNYISPFHDPPMERKALWLYRGNTDPSLSSWKLLLSWLHSPFFFSHCLPLYSHFKIHIFFFCKGYGNVRSDMEGLKGVQCQHIWGSLVMTRDPQMEAAEIQRSILFAQAERADGMRGA